MKMVEREAYQFFTTLSVPKLYRVNSDGRAKKLTMAMPAVMKAMRNTALVCGIEARLQEGDHVAA